MVLVAFWNAMVNAIRVLFFGLLGVFILISVMFFVFILLKAAKSPSGDINRKNF